ncbi:hypothetical protein [Streptomyces clavifer]|uniref:hypothetical protein n=1 Tax=Streptomyces clavifer TaxID=68188 RepID=UPI0033A1E46F
MTVRRPPRSVRSAPLGKELDQPQLPSALFGVTALEDHDQLVDAEGATAALDS